MKKIKKYPEIKPLFVKDSKGKKISVYLKIDVYESIFEELKEFEKIKEKIKKGKIKIL